MQRCIIINVFHIDICAGFDQQSNDFRIDLPNRFAQRGFAKIVFGVDICTGIYTTTGRFQDSFWERLFLNMCFLKRLCSGV